MADTAAADVHAEAEAYAQAILTRRIIRCRRVTKTHIEGGGCPACGL
jgi:hypothetical protein